MSTTLTNPEYPHFAEISRTASGVEPPFETTTTVIWSGEVDCQVRTSGGTTMKDDVFVSDYTIYCQCIPDTILKGDQIDVTLKEGDDPIKCKIEQSTTEDIWEVDGVKYGTTIWADKVSA